LYTTISTGLRNLKWNILLAILQNSLHSNEQNVAMIQHNQIPLPTKEEAEKIVAPIAEQFKQVFRKASEDWLTLYEKVRHILSARSRSAIFHDHIAWHAKAIFAQVPGIRVFTRKGIFTVCMENTADFRFKKLDLKMRSNNVTTGQSTKYSMQFKLDGFEDLPRLTAGYTLDELQLALARMCVTLQIGRNVAYVVDLTGGSGQQLLAFPKLPAGLPAQPQSRVRAKKGVKKIIEKE
jgi:hypothetical protein